MEVNEILLGLLGRALFASNFTFDPKTAPWETLMKEAQAQTVELLVFDALTGSERAWMPKEIAESWQFAALRRYGRNEQLRHEQEQILQALSKAEIPALVLKGFACAENYPNPILRCAGDIDLLVGKEGVERAKAVLEEMDYIASEEPHPFHVHMRKNQYVVELHHEPAGIPMDGVGVELRAFFAGSEKEPAQRNGIPVLPREKEVVMLLLHKLEHIVSSGLGLRQLCDWAVFLNREMTVEFWAELEVVLKGFGLLHFAKVITRICVEHLALPREKAEWCMDADGGLARRLLSDMLRTGNFGSKENRYGQRLFTDANSGNRLTSFIKVGTQACKDHWPVCEKYPILLPVAPVYLLTRYARQRKAGERPAFRPHAVYKSAKDRQALYAELKPFVQE